MACASFLPKVEIPFDIPTASHLGVFGCQASLAPPLQSGYICPEKPCSGTKDTTTFNLWHYPLHGTDLNGVNHTFFSYDPDFGGDALRESFSRVAKAEDCPESSDRLVLQSSLTLAVETLKCHEKEGKCVSNEVLYQLLGRCMDENNPAAGRGVHSLIAGNGLESNVFLGSCLIRMFTYFEELHEANEVFRKLVEPDVFTWTAILSANVKLGDNEWALELYRQMLEARVRPDGHVFVEILKACMGTDTRTHAHYIHASIIEHGLEDDAFVANSLIGSYGKSGTLEDVRTVFCRLPNHNTVTWSTLLSGCIYHHSSNEVPHLFTLMQQDGTKPDEGTYVCLLAAASDAEDLKQGRQVHKQILVCGALINSYVGNALIDMYVKCGCVEDAHFVFESLFSRDVVTWSSLILGYAEDGNAQEAFWLFDEMQRQGIQPNEVTHVNILKVCSVVELGHLVHEYLAVHGFPLTVQVGTALIDMYARCGYLSDALFLFFSLSEKNVITWSTMITGCFQ